MGTWVFEGHIFHGCPPEGWCAVLSSCPSAAGTLSNSIPPSEKWAYCCPVGRAQSACQPSPPPSPPLIREPPSSPRNPCQCLTSWRDGQNVEWHGCLSTGWCAVASDCSSFTGFTQQSTPPGQKWSYCSSSLPLQRAPPSPPLLIQSPTQWPRLPLPSPPTPPPPSLPPPYPPVRLPPSDPCQCLPTWRNGQKVEWHGCLSTGWCVVASDCSSYTGTTQQSTPPGQKWSYCGSKLAPPPPWPPSLPSTSQPCGFMRRTEDTDLVVRTGDVQIWTCAGVVTGEAVRIGRR